MGNIQNTYIDTFSVKNLTSNPVTLGDLVNCNIPANTTIDILKVPRVTKEKINQSVHLKQAVSLGLLRIVKSKFKNLSSSDQEMILPDLEDIESVSKGLKTKSLFISSPNATESIALWFTEQKIQFVEIRGITDLGTVTFNIVRAPAATPYAGGVSINDSAIVADTNGQIQSGLSISTVTSSFWIVFESTAISGGVTKLNVTISFKNIP